MTSAKQIRAGAIISYGTIFFNIVAGLVYTPWMIRLIGKDDYGLYVLAMSIITLFVFDFGLSVAATRFVAKHLADDKPEKANDCLGLVYKLYLIIDVVIFLVLLGVFFFIPGIYEELTPAEIDKFKIVYAIAASFSVLSFPFIPQNGILNAHEKFIQLKSCELGQRLFTVAAMVCCLLLGCGLYALVLVNAVGNLIAIGVKHILIRRYTGVKVNFRYKCRSELREILGYSGWTTIISIAQRLIFNVAPSILGILSGSASIAVLGLAITLEGFVYTFANALNGLFLPRVSQISAKEDGNVLPLMIRVGRIQIFVIGLLMVGFICLGADFIQLWVGEGFAGVYACTMLFIIPSFFQLPQEIASTAVLVMNKVRQQAYVFVFMALFNIIFAVVLARYYGALGIAISICIAYLLRTIGMNVIYYKELKIDILKFFRETFFRMGPPLIATFAVGWGIQWISLPAGWTGFFIRGALLVACYGVIMFRWALNADERRLMLSPVTRLIKHD